MYREALAAESRPAGVETVTVSVLTPAMGGAAKITGLAWVTAT